MTIDPISTSETYPGLLVLELVQGVDRLVSERDEARDELEGARQDLARADAQRRANLSWMAGQDLDIGGLQEQLVKARAEVERLRAAVSDLPDVGPVTRHAHDSLEPFECLVVDGTHFVRTDGSDHLRRVVAVYLTAAAEIDRLDREAEERAAADTTTDKPLEEALAHALELSALDEAEVQEAVATVLQVLDTRRANDAIAHRARTHGGDA